MAQQSRANEAHSAKKNQLQGKLNPGVETMGPQTALIESVPGPLGVVDQPTIQAQANRLGDSRLPPAQRQALAGQIGRRQGNGHLQRVVACLNKGDRMPNPTFSNQYGSGQKRLIDKGDTQAFSQYITPSKIAPHAGGIRGQFSPKPFSSLVSNPRSCRTPEIMNRVRPPNLVIFPPAPPMSSQHQIQRALPAVVPIVIWFGKAIAATSIDALIDFAIAAITGMPPPGFWAHVGNFFINLIPGLGEAKKVKKAAKLFKVIDKIIDIVKTLKKLRVPGAGNLLQRMVKEADQFKAAIRVAKLSEAKAALGRLIGFLREAQVISKLKEKGAKIIQIGKNIKAGKRIITEIDSITREGGQLMFNQVKAGKEAILTPGSDRWAKFVKQIDETVKAAGDASFIKQVDPAAKLGSTAKVRYYVDDISDEARKYLQGKGVEIRSTSELLK